VSLDSATDKLQGVLDAVTTSINQAVTGYTSVKTSMLAEFTASSKRLEGQTATLAELETTWQLSTERTAGLEAELANLVGQETDAHTSYESAVAQRGSTLQKHLSSHKSHSDQANAIGEVLEMMKQKKAAVVASQESTEDMKVVPPTSPTASASGLDYVIGVMSNMKDSSLAKAEEGSEKHNKDDSDLERLVTSYKTSLQHIDKQYQETNKRRMEAKVTARDSAEEKTLRNMLVDGEEKLDKEFVGLCGATGKGGSVPAAIEAADYLLATIKQQTASAVSTMDKLPDLQEGAASLLDVKPHKQLRGVHDQIVYTNSTPTAPVAVPRALVVAKSTAQDAAESAQESAARWVMSMATKMKDNTTQHFAQQVAASFPNGVPSPKAHPVRIVAPSQQVHNLVGTASAKQAVGQATKAGDSEDTVVTKEAAEVIACMKDKQDLTDKIIAARKAARTARTDKMSADARVIAVANFQELTEKQKDVLTAAQKSVEAGWKPMRDLAAAKSIEADLADAEAEMVTIETDVKAYIDAGGPPAAAGLPTALKGIRDTLATAKTRLTGDMEALDGVYTGALMISYPALINQLVNKDKDLGFELSAMKDVAEMSKEAVTKEETAEEDLMVQRAGVEYRCLQPGQCANLHYQQCCSGSGTFSKKVMSWSECAAHCEAIVAEKKTGIAGCEMTDLAKEDDRTGSGTCFATTTCDLKPSKLQCAGSLCKALPADA
jgi:hypothetical protein